MTVNKFQSVSYCVGGTHRSATKKIYGDITSKDSKVVFGFCPIGNRKKSMTVSDNTIKAEGLGNFFQNLGKQGLNVSKKMAKNVLNNPTTALDITANIATAAASRSPKNVMKSLPELITFYNTGKGLYLGKFVKILPYKGIKKVTDCIPMHHLKIKILILNKNWKNNECC